MSTDISTIELPVLPTDQEEPAGPDLVTLPEVVIKPQTTKSRPRTKAFLKKQIAKSAEPSAPLKAKPKKASVMTINLSNCKYDIVRECALDFGFKIVEDSSSSWFLNWMDTGEVEAHVRCHA